MMTPVIDRGGPHRAEVVALSGLSEAGTSAAGDYLAARHGYARLKIGYLLESAAARCGIADVHALDDAGMAKMLVLGLEAYCAAHHFQRHVCVESLHRAGMTAELARLLGNHLTVIYLDASAGLGELRKPTGPADVPKEDAPERLRDAERIRQLSDVVIDSSDSRLNLYRTLDEIAVSRRWPRSTPQQTTVASLGLPSCLAAYLDALLARVADPAAPLVSLLAVTGSGARGRYQHGWSDLDVLALAGQDKLGRLRKVLADLAGWLDGVKLGFTVVTEAECAAGGITPRLLHTLALIGSGRLPVLWSDSALLLPRPDQEADVLASVGDGIAAAIEIRRQLLRPALELRSLYKATALVAKVGLRADGTDYPDDADALHALMDQFPSSFSDLDHDVVATARLDEQAATELARAVLEWWLSAPTAAESSL